MLKKSIYDRIKVETYMKTLCLYKLCQIRFIKYEWLPPGFVFPVGRTGRDINNNCYR